MNSNWTICQVQRCHQTRTHQCYDLDYVDSDAVASLLAIKFCIANHNGLLQCIFKTLMPGQGNLLIGFGTSRHLDTTGSFLSVSMSKLWVPKSMVKLSSMLYLAVI